MLKSLRIQNFKGWKDTGEMHLAPLTILFGSNSSGKSSIGQFLMLLKQSIEMSDRKTVLLLGSENAPVDLGSPLNMINNHDINKKLRFEYSWSTEKQLIFSDALHKKNYFCDIIDFKAEIRIKETNRQTLEVPFFEYRLNSTPEIVVGLSKEDDKNISSREYRLKMQNYDFIRQTGRPWGITQPMRFYGFPEEAVAYYQNASFLLDINLWHEKQFQKISYLGPLRSKAKRIYAWSGQSPASVNYAGEDTVSALLAASSAERRINLGNKQIRKDFKVIIAEMLHIMGLVNAIKVDRIAKDRQEYDVKVRINKNDDWMDILDVGFGVSQVLPVIVQLFYAEPGSTIIMEQPELHLHPSAQAGLADVMIAAIKAKENYESRNIQLIIETHSEHFLRRLQRRIAENQISESEVSAYFVHNQDEHVTLEPLQIDLFGNIRNWPDGFFGDLAEELYQQANAAIKRRITERDLRNE